MAPDEGPRGGEPVRILPEARTRRRPCEVDARSGHTQQDCHVQQATQTLVLSLEKYGFRTRRDRQGSTEYEVVDLMEDEVDNGFREKRQDRKTEEEDKDEGVLPF